MTDRAVIYLRDSGGVAQELSTEQQERALRKYCAEVGLEIDRVFADAARSGTSLVGRDGFLQMVEYLDSAGKHTVILWDYSRLARDYDDGQYYLTLLRRAGHEITSIKEHVPDGLVGRVVESLHVYTAAQYSQQLSANVKRGLHYLASVHKSWVSGPPPTGYMFSYVEIGKRRDGSPHFARRLVPDPEKAPLATLAFEMRAEGRTAREVHERVHFFRMAPAYHRMFRQRVYTGTLDYHGTIVPDFCEPLVTPDVWAAVQARTRQHPRRETSAYLLSGLVVCAACGWKLAGNTATKKNGSRYGYYCCIRDSIEFGVCQSFMIRRAELDDLVLDRLRDLFLSPEMLRQVRDRLAAEFGAHEATNAMRAAALRQDIDAIDRKRRKLVLSIEEDDAPPRAVLERLRELEQDQQGKREELALLDSVRPSPPPPVESLEALGAELWEAIQDARENDPRTLQLLMRSMIGEIRAVKRADGRIYGDILINEVPGVGAAGMRLSL